MTERVTNPAGAEIDRDALPPLEISGRPNYNMGPIKFASVGERAQPVTGIDDGPRARLVGGRRDGHFEGVPIEFQRHRAVRVPAPLAACLDVQDVVAALHVVPVVVIARPVGRVDSRERRAPRTSVRHREV